MRIAVLSVWLGVTTLAGGQCIPQWSPVGSGSSGPVNALLHDTVNLPAFGPFYVGGSFVTLNGIAVRHVGGRINGVWSNMAGGMTAMTGDHVLGMTMWPEPGSPLGPPQLHAVGDFEIAGGVVVNNVARWNGTGWEALGTGFLNSAFCARGYDEDGSGPSHSVLYVGANSAAPLALQRWNGVEWQALPEPLHPDHSGNSVSVRALEVFDDDGAGPRRPRLYVGGGKFDGAAGIYSHNIIRWDGQNWEGMNGGANSIVYALAVFDDDGPGPRQAALFASGSFSWAGGVMATRFARWDGQAWTAAPGLNSNARALAVFDDDGPGPNPPALFATGLFNDAGLRIAKYLGPAVGWHPLGSGLMHPIGSEGYALAVYDEDGPGPNPGGLYVGGLFTSAGGVPANYIARWGCPLNTCYPDCNNDGALNLADFGCFQTNFATGNMQADCNQDATLNLADFGCFQTRFALGCP